MPLRRRAAFVCFTAGSRPHAPSGSVLPHRAGLLPHSVAPPGRRGAAVRACSHSDLGHRVADEVSDAESYRYANTMIVGMARVRARRIDGEVIGLALWDGRRGKGGGTGSALRGWVAAGVPVTAIDPLTGKTRLLVRDRGPRLEDRPAPRFGRRETVATLAP